MKVDPLILPATETFNKRRKIDMDSKTQIMVSLGTAIGANCIPCFDHLYARARELDINDEEIQRIIEIASKVKNGASIFMKNAVNEFMGTPPESEVPCCDQSKGSCC